MVLAAALAAAVTVSGVAFAAQVRQERVHSAPEPLTTLSASPSHSSALPSVPDDHGVRVVRPSRSAVQDRSRLEERRTRRSNRTEPSAKASRSPSPSPVPETPRPTAPQETPEVAASAPESTTTASSPRADRILEGTNAARADAGLTALRVDPCLARMAQRHAQRLAASGSLYHQDLGTVMASCGTSTAGENVAMNHTGAADMVDQWLGSSGHRANLLNSRFTLIGIGVARARDGAWYGVQVFGSR